MTHRLVVALPHHCIEPPRFLEQVLQEEIWPFYSLGIPYSSFAKGRRRNKLFGKKGNWALITIQKDAPNMPCNTIKRQNTSCYILLHTEAIGQTGPRKLYSLSRMFFSKFIPTIFLHLLRTLDMIFKFALQPKFYSNTVAIIKIPQAFISKREKTLPSHVKVSFICYFNDKTLSIRVLLQTFHTRVAFGSKSWISCDA